MTKVIDGALSGIHSTIFKTQNLYCRKQKLRYFYTQPFRQLSYDG